MARFKAQFLQILKKKNVIAGFLLGMIAVLSGGIKYREYMGAYNVCFAEPYIISLTKAFTFINIGFLIVVFDAPFIDNLSISGVYRKGRKKWYRSSWLYIIRLSVTYHLFLFMVSLIPFITRAYPDNNWSVVISGVYYDINRFMKLGLTHPSRQFIEGFSPVSAIIISFVLINMYSILSGAILYVFNMIFKNISIGGALFIAGEFVSFFFVRVALVPGLRKFSAKVNGIPSWAYDKSVADISFSFMYFVFLIYLAYIIGDMFIFNVDFVLKSGDRVQE